MKREIGFKTTKIRQFRADDPFYQENFKKKSKPQPETIKQKNPKLD
jgi:hypothetical protein